MEFCIVLQKVNSFASSAVVLQTSFFTGLSMLCLQLSTWLHWNTHADKPEQVVMVVADVLVPIWHQISKKKIVLLMLNK